MPGIQNSKSTLDFLGTIGSTDRGDGVTLNHTAQALVNLADFLIDHAVNNLKAKANIASGATSDSMEANEIQIDGTKMYLDIKILSTYKFLDKGVQGTEGGSGKYKFKTKYPNKKMALAILKWLRKRSIALKYKAISKTERKNQRIKKMVNSSDKLKSLAYAVSTNIKKTGIRPTNFFTKAVTATKAQSKKEFSNALKLDIIDSLSNINLS